MYGRAVPAGMAEGAVQGCTRGGAGRVGTGVGTGRGYTGTQAQTVPGTHIELNLASGPTYGQMKVN